MLVSSGVLLKMPLMLGFGRPLTCPVGNGLSQINRVVGAFRSPQRCSTLGMNDPRPLKTSG